MKNNQRLILTLAMLWACNSIAVAQDRYDNDDNHRNRERRNNKYSDDRDEREDHYYNYNDRRNDRDRIRDYERSGRNNYRRNPYDYRNLPNDWQRMGSSRFDWFRFDIYNRWDPRWYNRYDYDLYYPWDPANPYDIRNQRDYYGSARYWSGHRPTRILIVPPPVHIGMGRSYGHYHSRKHGGRYGRR
jgi:hypothetical protein